MVASYLGLSKREGLVDIVSADADIFIATDPGEHLLCTLYECYMERYTIMSYYPSFVWDPLMHAHTIEYQALSLLPSNKGLGYKAR